MSEKSKHTPTPWKANKWAPGWEISAPESHYTVCRLTDCNNEEANAAFIVRACNSHDELLEALKGLLLEVTGAHSGTSSIFAEELKSGRSFHIAVARAAIAKAEGQGA